MANVAEIKPRLLRVREAAALAGVCVSRGYEFAADGTWPVVKLGKSVRIPRRGLDAWIDQMEREAGLEPEDAG
ncbi:MAG: helix-turn-helix domain-containing protein [Candidatus Desulforudis sp.]|nr:helix-turn-helix domain-containing protein [Desulforudis sp.]